MSKPPLLIASAGGSYCVSNTAEISGLRSQLAAFRDAVMLIDRNVASLFPETLEIIENESDCLRIDCQEEDKTLDGCTAVLKFLQARSATKQTRVIAIGGGILQDIATLSTHLYYRGLEWIYVPTTLLGMSDSCIGAKASINFNGFKNQLGAFHAPREILICDEFLSTLPVDQIRSGFGEIVKLAIAGDPKTFEKIESELKISGFKTKQVIDFIWASLVVKKKVIEVDEFDTGIRKTLNYGHTFGHALEAITDHEVPHGLAVAWGIDLINFIAVQRNILASADFERIHKLLSAYFSSSISKTVQIEKLLSAARRDKKVSKGRLTIVVPKCIGSLELIEQDFNDELYQWISQYLSSPSNILHLAS